LPKIAFHEYPGNSAVGLAFLPFSILSCRLLSGLNQHFCRKSRFTNTPAILPMGRHFCRFATLPYRLFFDQTGTFAENRVSRIPRQFFRWAGIFAVLPSCLAGCFSG